jgi:hypothetical protein
MHGRRLKLIEDIYSIHLFVILWEMPASSTNDYFFYAIVVRLERVAVT